MKKKVVNFFMCDGCFGLYPVGTGFNAPKNKYNFKKVCKSCFKQYISPKAAPVPHIAAPVLKNQYGSHLSYGGAGILSNANGALISNANGSLISNASGKAVPTNAGNLIGNDSAGLIGNDGST